MPPLVFLVDSLFELLLESMDWLTGLWPDQFVRVFWAFVFLEIPRYLLTDLFVLVNFLVKDRHAGATPHHLEARPLVSVILPALNEEQTIANTVRSLIEQDYENLEIIVVDDGSTDGTREICEALAERGVIRFFPLAERQGKSAALNYGTRVSRGEYIIFMDTDSTLDRNVIHSLLEYFEDDNVGAVSGNLGVRNVNRNLLTRLQAIEYLVSITVGRWFRATAGILSIVPGAFGAFRRTLLERVGGHEPGPGNDSGLTIRIRKLGKQVMFAHDATCLTNVPERWWSWLRQRMRWDRNVVRNRVRKHRDTFNVFNASYTFRNVLASLDTIFFAACLSLVWLAYAIDVVVSYPDRFELIILANFGLHLCLKIVQFFVALAVSDRRLEYLGLIVYLPLFGVYRVISKLVRIAATLQELLFRWSYRDPFAPEKVRKQMEVY